MKKKNQGNNSQKITNYRKKVDKFNYIKNFNFSATEDTLKLSKNVRC